MKTLLILVTYNGYHLTKDCLSKLQGLPSSEWKIVVADNGSQDFTPEKVRKDFSDVEVYEVNSNRGFGFANNYAFRKAREKEDFDFVCFLNNDTLPSKSSLEILRDSLAKEQGKVIFAPKVLNLDGSLQRNDYCFLPGKDFFLNAFRSEAAAAKVLHGNPSRVSSSYLQNDWVNGVCLMMKAQTFQEVGMFDENIFMYYEDTDFAFRAKNLGYAFYIVESSEIVHLGGGSSKNSLSQSLQHDSSQLYFYRKHFGLKGAFLSRAFRLCRSGIRMLFLLIPSLWDSTSRSKFILHFKLFLKALF